MEDEQLDSSTLRVCRIGDERLGVIRIFTVFVDNRRTEDVGLGECVDVQLPPGRHSVCVRMDRVQSNTLDLDVRAGFVTELTIELLEDQSPSFFRWLLPALLRYDFDWTKMRLVELPPPDEGSDEAESANGGTDPGS